MNAKKIAELGALFILALSFVALCVFMYMKADYMLDSDMSSEMVLAELLSNENGIISSNWFYSTEIRVLNTQIVWAFLFRFFDNWHLVRVLGSALCYLFLIGSYLFFCKQLKMTKTAAFLSATVLLLPTSEMYRRFVFVNVGYVIYFINSFLIFGMLLKYAETRKKIEIVALIGGMTVLSLLSGMAGLRQFLTFYIPIIIAAFIWDLWVRKEDSRRFFLFSLYSGLIAGIGYLINSKVLSKYFRYQKFNDIEYMGLSFNRLEDVLNGCMESLGYCVELELFEGVLYNLFAFAVFVVLVADIRSAFNNFREYEKEKQILHLFFVIALIVFAALYLFSDMDWFSRYVLPVMVFTVPIVFLYLQDKKRWKKYVSVLLLGLLAVNSYGRYKLFYQIDETKALREVATYVTENGYAEGYATFWNANVLTELTNGHVGMRNWKDSSDGIGMSGVTDIDQIHEWLQLVRYTQTVPEGKCFILLTHDEKTGWPLSQYISQENLVFSNEKYYVYGFEGYEMIPAELK